MTCVAVEAELIEFYNEWKRHVNRHQMSILEYREIVAYS